MQARAAEVSAQIGLPALDAAVAESGGPELDAATQERLKELGYAQ
jgi:hypothetical protein